MIESIQFAPLECDCPVPIARIGWISAEVSNARETLMHAPDFHEIGFGTKAYISSHPKRGFIEHVEGKNSITVLEDDDGPYMFAEYKRK